MSRYDLAGGFKQSLFINSNLALFLVFAFSVCIIVSALILKNVQMSAFLFLCVYAWHIGILC